MRHATRTVLGREIPDEALMATVGGPGLEAQMLEFGGEEHLEALVTLYRAHNEPLHDELEIFAGMDDVLIALKDEGRKLGLVSAKRRSTVELAFAATAIGHLFDVVVGGDETAPAEAGARHVAAGARAARRAPGRRRLRRRLAVRHGAAKAGGPPCDRRHLGRRPRARRSSPRPTRSSRRRRSSLPPSDVAGRVAELRERVSRWSHEYHVLDAPVGLGRRVRPRLRRAQRARAPSIPSSSRRTRPRSGSARRPRSGS